MKREFHSYSATTDRAENMNYGEPLPADLADRVLLDVGRSSQATLNGNDHVTMSRSTSRGCLKYAGSQAPLLWPTSVLRPACLPNASKMSLMYSVGLLPIVFASRLSLSATSVSGLPTQNQVRPPLLDVATCV